MRAIALRLVLACALALSAAPAIAQDDTVEQVASIIFDQLEKEILRDLDLDEIERLRGRGRGPDHVPPGHMPPPGECRAWLPSTPPGQQPPPGNCALVAASLPFGAELIYGGARRDTVLPRQVGRELPGWLEDRLPRRTGTERIVYGDDVVLVDRTTRVILDVLTGVLRR